MGRHGAPVDSDPVYFHAGDEYDEEEEVVEDGERWRPERTGGAAGCWYLSLHFCRLPFLDRLTWRRRGRDQGCGKNEEAA